MNNIINLKDIISIADFQNIQDDIAKATEISIITTDYKGKPVTKHSCCTEFCSIIRRDKKQSELCERCDSRGGIEATRTGKPYIYICHKGLVDFAVPIIVQGQYIGDIMAGQVLINQDEQKYLESVTNVNCDLGGDQELIYAYNRLPTIPLEKIKNISQMILHLSKYLVEEGMHKITVKKLNESSEQSTKLETEQIKLQNNLEKLKLKSLYTQISPKFVFNIMNNIYSLALIEDAEKTSDLTYKFTEFIRNTFYKSNKVVTLKEELDYCLDYLNLQKIRFSDRLSFSISLGNVDNFKLPFMSIFPFVENSIVHGIMEKEDVGDVNIVVDKKDEFIIISVTDDGIGIPEEKLKFINSEENNINYSLSGIVAAKQRIKNFYRYDYFINVVSDLNKWTKVIISLPIDER
ncbi:MULTISPECIES: PocR ligand-binding domain-containing protein [Clostridium]|uniref:Histidine kinase n=1 Tax=Clostridium beijerinckii TaxID=1520 RepID=A0A1S9N174_CLOBE|nr:MULTISPECIES: PocR ligand-binding domain-containing protein [Clostridium]MBN7575196.1 PocR ligand-binding domain-containing protein [Clostridium beijerinckii]MBN7580499.1 PocR ligand-binding domain-containing protein [Clostridium beijerinckii]MBN7584960.1 PocR ligand-binding domain-containing protein [Clostridium beijerinckii]MBO0520546.1 PocR ligand-binding domain-containing protein [Clostridium beijerinckii]MZK50540.1 histidine kinase [Clostridium beijerinckii]